MKSSAVPLLVALASSVWAQAQPEVASHEAPITFSSRVNLVSVPVVIRDRDGKAVGALRRVARDDRLLARVLGADDGLGQPLLELLALLERRSHQYDREADHRDEDLHQDDLRAQRMDRGQHMPVAGESVSVVQLERAIRSARSEKE